MTVRALALTIVIATTGGARADPLEMVTAYLQGRLASDELDARVATELATRDPIARAEAIRGAVLVGRAAAARAAFETWRATGADTVEQRLLGLELALLDAPVGGPLDAPIHAGCVGPVLDAELWCHRFVHWHTPSLRRLRANALDPAATDLDWLSEARPTELAIGNAIARGLRAAKARCDRVAATAQTVAITFEPIRAGEASPRFVSAHGEDAAVAYCVWQVMSAVALPPAANGKQPITTDVELAPIPGQPPERAAIDHDGDGAIAYLLDRQGAMAGHALGLAARYEAGTGERRALAAVRTELGSTRDGARSYLARGEVGVALHTTSQVELSVAGGIGIARAGDAVPRHLEIPFEFRLRFDVGHFVGNAWLRSDTDDNLDVGVGVTFPVSGVHYFLGTAVEQHAQGSSTFVMIGLPIGTAL